MIVWDMLCVFTNGATVVRWCDFLVYKEGQWKMNFIQLDNISILFIWEKLLNIVK